MDIRSSISQSRLLSDLMTIAGALREAFLLGLGVLALFFVFQWDAASDNPFSEVGPTEFIQSVALGLSLVLFFLEARRRPEMRGGLILVGGFIGCMLIREQDYFLDTVTHGFWKWPALALAFSCLAYAAATFRATVAGLANFIRWRYFSVLLIGLVIVLAYSRLFGMSILWRELLRDCHWRMAKTAVEESSELLGYLFVVFSALLLRFEKRSSNTDNTKKLPHNKQSHFPE